MITCIRGELRSPSIVVSVLIGVFLLFETSNMRYCNWDIVIEIL